SIEGHRSRAPRSLADHLPGEPEIGAGDLRPDARARVEVGALPHGIAFAPVLEEIDDGLAELFRVVERKEPTSTVREHLLGVPEGGRDDGLARAEGVSERARRDLRLLRIRPDVDVRGADVADALVQGDAAGG